MIHSRIYNSNQNHHSGNFQKVLKTEEKNVPDKIKNFYNYWNLVLSIKKRSTFRNNKEKLNSDVMQEIIYLEYTQNFLKN